MTWPSDNDLAMMQISRRSTNDISFIELKARSEIDQSLIIEDSYIQAWQIWYLQNMEEYQALGREIYYTDKTYNDPNKVQRRKLQSEFDIICRDPIEEWVLTKNIP